LYINVEAAQAAREDVEGGVRAIIAEIIKRADQSNFFPNPGSITINL
jgi:hypothetical protein